jgi:hypothetical protein
MFFVLLWLFGAGLAAAIAHSKGRSAVGLFFLGLLIGWIAVIVAVSLRPNRQELSK